MTKVLHYDYIAKRKYNNPDFEEFQHKLKKTLGIEYHLYLDPYQDELSNKFDRQQITEDQIYQMFNYKREPFILEAIKQNKPDVFLIHPGTNNQRWVIKELPKKFRKMDIIILSYLPSDYKEESKGKIKLFGYHQPNKIIEAILKSNKTTKSL